MNWRDEAECAGAPLDVFFPEKGGSAAAARGYCNRCPVTAECLETALAMGPQQYVHGIYGGLTRDERAQLERRLCGDCGGSRKPRRMYCDDCSARRRRESRARSVL